MQVLFGIALAASAALTGSLLCTLLWPALRIWPPPGRTTWQYRLTWTLFALAFGGFLIVGGVDQGSLGLKQWLGAAGLHIVGSLLLIGGTAVASYAMGVLGLRGCLGLNADLVTEGPFQVSRHPGYVGDLLLLAGYVVLSNSVQAAWVAALAAPWFLLAPWAEEPWLASHYGDAYRRYQARVARFVDASALFDRLSPSS